MDSETVSLDGEHHPKVGLSSWKSRRLFDQLEAQTLWKVGKEQRESHLFCYL